MKLILQKQPFLRLLFRNSKCIIHSFSPVKLYRFTGVFCKVMCLANVNNSVKNVKMSRFIVLIQHYNGKAFHFTANYVLFMNKFIQYK
jgi:hypothetical protein